MKKYLVVLRGHNYLLPYDGEPRKMGFTATRMVRANSPEEAEAIVRGNIVRDPRLVRELLNGSRDPSSLEVETIRKLGLFKSLSSSPQGLEFFFEDLPEAPDPTGEPQ
jgi:hypothetical protein